MGTITWSALSRAVGQLMADRGEWCGLPMPVQGHTLTLEPRNPWAPRVDELNALAEDDNPRDHVHVCYDEVTPMFIVNSWYSRSLQCTITILNVNGRYTTMRHGHAIARRTDLIITAVGTSSAWNMDAELTAQERLSTLIKPHLFRSYLLTGVFLETSPRSGLKYVFRRNRPTLVVSPHDPSGNLTVICALCLHPIGYYENTFSGSLTPTDEVIAHLLLMRADEPLFWRRANQHPPYLPESGL